MEKQRERENKSRLAILICLVLLSCLFSATNVQAVKRVALVIGNGNYRTAPLKNPVNDAGDIARVLKKLGFEVIARTNANKREMVRAIDSFAAKLRQADIGLFYYAGHGMQINGANYLIPVSVDVASESDVEFEAVHAGRILGKMKQAENQLNVVILDACRNNPFQRSFRSAEKGLARMDAPIGTIIAYATGPGSVAADGKGRNGMYTKHLLRALPKSDLDIQDIFNEAGMQVMRETGKKQVPWTSSTPIPRYYLAGGNPDDLVSDAPVSYKETHTTGALKVTSRPAGAEVQLDGEAAGQTPLQLGNMPVGPVRVSVAKNGYAEVEQRTTIKAGRRTVLAFDLQEEEKNGWLTVRTTPTNARVRILNIGPGYSPGMQLDAGRYHIEVSAADYTTEKRWVELGAGDDISVDFRLEQKRAAIAVTKSVAKPQSSSSRPSGRKYTDPTTNMQFVWVKGGCFQMGDTFGDGDSDERPVHEVCVDGFYMGKYEVTQGEYKKLTGSNPSYNDKGDLFPVEKVSWNDAQAFIKQLNRGSGKQYRLPTEAEWEYAARSGGRKEKYSGSNSVDSVAWSKSNSGGSTHKVGRKAANGLGLYDMSGNVWEWCSDWYWKNYYASSPGKNPTGPSSGSYRVNRGGSWLNAPRGVRAAGRNWNRPVYRSYDLGFRLVLSGQ